VRTVNIPQLTSALAGHEPDPGAVLAALRTKRRRRNRTRGLSAAAVVFVVAVAVVVWRPWTPSPPPAENPPQEANGCASMSLADTLAAAVRGGATVILANGSLTSAHVLDNQAYDEMRLHSVRTLAGPALAADSTGWVAGGSGPAGPLPGADAGALWAPDGSLFAIAWPADRTGTKVGPLLRVAPVVDGQVIFSSAGCWDTTGLASRPYSGRLAEVPGSGSRARAAAGGFHAVPLTDVEKLLPR
jgi:hypothetical protein